MRRTDNTGFGRKQGYIKIYIPNTGYIYFYFSYIFGIVKVNILS